MKNNKLLSLILALILANSALLTGCSESTADETQPSGTEKAETEIETETETIDPASLDNLPEDLDFEDEDFIMHTKIETWPNWSTLVEDQNGEVLNDTMYDMQINVEERLHVKISEAEGKDIIRLVKSGDTTFDAVNVLDRDAVSYAMNNIFLPLDQIQYMDTSKLYWNSELTETLAIGDIDFLVLGCFNLQSYRKTACLFMNLKVADDYQVEVPYDAINEGTWTLDMLETYRNVANSDLDNDGVYTIDDSVTFCSFDSRQIPLDLVVATGMNIVSKNENNIPVLSVYGSEKFVDIMEYCKDLFFNDTENVMGSKGIGGGKDMFTHNRALFSVGFMDHMSLLRDMDADYTVLPVPKYDETQQKYISRTLDCQFTSLLTTVENADMSGAVLEALSSYAYANLIPAYIESSLQEKYARVPEAVECIQICFDGRSIELAEMFVFDVFGDSPCWYIMQEADFNVVSWLETSRKEAETALNKVITKIEKNYQ